MEDPSLSPSHPPSALSPSASPSPTTTTTPNFPGPSYPPQSGLIAARALLNHNRRVEGLSRTSAPKKRMSIRDAAAKWGASRSTVARHLKALVETNKPFLSDNPPGRPRALTRPEEDALAAFCAYLARGGCMRNVPLVRGAADELRARRDPPAGPLHRRWVCRWLDGREDGMTLRELPGADRQCRIEGDVEEVVKGFFDRYFKEDSEGGGRTVEERAVVTCDGREGRSGIGTLGTLEETKDIRVKEEQQRPQYQPIPFGSEVDKVRGRLK